MDARAGNPYTLAVTRGPDEDRTLPAAPADGRPVVAIAGATGFVGAALREALTPRFRVIGLTRSPLRASRHADDPDVEWRHCDLFSLLQVEQALEGVDYAIYLVHSMLPSARLVQADFRDLDLILADNFARAAEKNGVRQLLYLGGLLPEGEAPSPHLVSRHEVERTLADRSVPLTALRAGLVVGPGGSSLRILLNLVRRLPVMLLPRWTQATSRPVAVADVTRAMLDCIGDPDAFGRTYDLGGPEELSYADLLTRTARALDVRRRLVPLPVLSPRLSTLWVSLVSGASLALVGPLIESLRHSLRVRDNPVQRRLLPEATGFDEALRDSVDAEGRPLPNPRRELLPLEHRKIRQDRFVRSVQRMPLPGGRTARWVADEYMRWLPRFVWPFLRATVAEGRAVRFALLGLRRWPLLELTLAPDRSRPDRQLFYITGGLLVRDADRPDNPGRFEFREVLDRSAIIAAIHDFRPALPWHVYQWTQAVVHLIVMRGFARHLGRTPPALAPGDAPADAGGAPADEARPPAGP